MEQWTTGPDSDTLIGSASKYPRLFGVHQGPYGLNLKSEDPRSVTLALIVVSIELGNIQNMGKFRPSLLVIYCQRTLLDFTRLDAKFQVRQ